MVPCKSCSDNLVAVQNETKANEALKEEVATLESNLQGKILALKASNEAMLDSMKLIDDKLIKRGSIVTQNSIYLRKGTRKVINELKLNLANFEEKKTLLEKWKFAGKQTEPETSKESIQVRSVTSLAANDGFEATEVFQHAQVKTENIKPSEESSVVQEVSTPVVESLVKVESFDIPVRKTRQRMVYQTVSFTTHFNSQVLKVRKDKVVGKEPEVVEMDVDGEESRPPVAVPSTSTSKPEALITKYDALLLSIRERCPFGIDYRQQKRKIEKEGPGTDPEEIFLRKTLITHFGKKVDSVESFAKDGQVCDNTILIAPQDPYKWFSGVMTRLNESKNSQRFFLDIPNLTSEMFHTLVVKLKEANLLKLLTEGDYNFHDEHDGLLNMVHFDPPFFQAVESMEEVIEERTLNILSGAGLDFNRKNNREKNVLFPVIANNRSLSLLKSLIKRGADVKFMDSDGRNLLHWAVIYKCNEEILEVLIKEGVDMDMKDRNSKTPVDLLQNFSNFNKRLSLLKLFVNDEDLRNHSEGGTALHAFLKSEKEKTGDRLKEVIEFLTSTDRKGFFNVGNKMGTTPLHLIIRGWEITAEILDVLKTQTESDFSLCDNDGHGVFHYAIAGSNGNPEVLQSLIETGANIKGRTKEYNETLLHFALRRHASLETIDFLLEKGFSVSMKDKFDNRPLDIAAFQYTSNKEVISKLIIQSFDKGILFSSGIQILHLAAQYGTPEVVKYLLEKYMDPNQKSPDGLTPFLKVMIFEDEDSVEKARLLLKAKANAHVVTKDGKGVLHHIAESSRNLKALQFCLEELKLDVNAKDNEGKTPLLSLLVSKTLSSEMEIKLKMATLLVEKGADVDTEFKFIDYLSLNSFDLKSIFLVKSPLILALRAGGNPTEGSSFYFDFVQLLLEKGANASEVTPTGWTPLDSAIRRPDKIALKLTKMLVKHGADITGRTWGGQNVLHIAAGKRNFETMSFCLNLDKEQKNVNELDYDKRSTLDLLLPNDEDQKNVEEVILKSLKLLLRNGANENIREKAKAAVQSRLQNPSGVKHLGLLRKILNLLSYKYSARYSGKDF